VTFGFSMLCANTDAAAPLEESVPKANNEAKRKDKDERIKPESSRLPLKTEN
jgi:hypothetical protein